MNECTRILLTAGTGGLAGALAGILWQIVHEWWNSKKRRKSLLRVLIRELNESEWLLKQNSEAAHKSGRPFATLPLSATKKVLFDGEYGFEQRDTEPFEHHLRYAVHINTLIASLRFAQMGGLHKDSELPVSTLSDLCKDEDTIAALRSAREQAERMLK